MHFTIRNASVVTISKAAAALLIATSFGAGTATADDSWKLTVNNTGSAPLKVVILDTTSKDITGDRSAEYISKGSGWVMVKKKGTYSWQVIAKGDSQPCQRQSGVSGSSITVQCEARKEEKPAATATPTPSSTSTSLSGTQQSGSGCSLSNITSKGCPPKVVQEMNDLRKKADEADKALAQVEADLNSLGPKDKAKLDAVYQRYIQAKATADYLKGMTGKQQSGQPAENIDYKTKYEKKEDDLGKVLKAKATAILGCVPQFSKTSIGCERETNVGGGKK